MKTPGRRWSALLPLLIALPVLAVPGVAQAESARGCFDDAAAITVEEKRLTATLPSGGPAVGPELVRLAGFDKLVADFTSRLCSTKTAPRAEKLAETAGDGLWRTAVDRAQGRRPDLGTLDKADDRPLYWARLQMSKALRQWTPRFPLSAPARADLLKTFDVGARGLDDSRFPLGPSTRRVLVSGFDPFTLNGAGVRIANPSGAAALHLDGKVIQTPTGPALVQAVSFPVVWSYFDTGIVEAAYGKALKDRFRRPELIMTISQGRPGRFDIERWAGAWRGGFPDNLDESVTGQVPPARGWPQPADQFIETTLPYEKMLAAPAGAYQVLYNQAFCVWPDSTKPGTGTAVCRTDAPKPGEIAASGGGGNYLSNESMYRSNRLRTGLGLTGIAGGHLHTPVLGTPTDPAALTDAGFEGRRAAITSQIVSLLTAALGEAATPAPATPAPATPAPGASPRADVLATPGTTL
ncbi:hypothetical protein [Amycolatopsis pittospori]|uniref:hypothetical protein n=1 Tax=Amycolatopsis pittospori TaxID=2749434 RepID=UPI001F1CA5D5|nr:hypothetical protein [Amycolatopsis pittospori]